MNSIQEIFNNDIVENDTDIGMLMADDHVDEAINYRYSKMHNKVHHLLKLPQSNFYWKGSYSTTV